MLENEAFKALGAYPIVEAAVAILILLNGVFLMRRGEKDTKDNPQGVPQWLLIAPAHDVMQSVHDISEEMRKQTELLDRIESNTRHAAQDSRQAIGLLEVIRSESRLR